VAINWFQALAHGSDHVRGGGDAARGTAVQVEPMKPELKAPGTKRLKLSYDEPPSNCAFNFNVRRYSVEQSEALRANLEERLAHAADKREYMLDPASGIRMAGGGPSPVKMAAMSATSTAGAYTRPHLCST
jgi:hypothetical protein